MAYFDERGPFRTAGTDRPQPTSGVQPDRFRTIGVRISALNA
jgi:hypothetical protein